MNVTCAGWNDRWHERPFVRKTQHSSDYDSKSLVKSLLALGVGPDPGRNATAVFAGRAGGQVIGARQVIVVLYSLLFYQG